MVKFGGDKPYEPIGPQGFPMQLPKGQLGPGYSPGSIRNTLGSGLKASGFFQKDGKVQNLRGGFIGAKQPPYQGPLWQTPAYIQGNHNSFPQPDGGSIQGDLNQGLEYTQEQGYDQGMAKNYGYNQPQVRQLILQPAQEGINANGAATISPDNVFLLIANLPAPQMFLGHGQTGVYAAYLVDDKGKTGFLVGGLRSVGNGVYRAHFQSQVPLHYYNRVVVSVENPTQIGQAPKGPIILKVKEPMGMMAFLSPMKNTATTVWGKISGLISGKKVPPIAPEAVPVNPELLQPPIPPSSPPTNG